MFLGAALRPDYFKEKINLYIALAPVACTINWSAGGLEDHIEMLEFLVVDIIKYYNWFKPMPKLSVLISLIIDWIPSVGDKIKNSLLNCEVNNCERV